MTLCGLSTAVEKADVILLLVDHSPFRLVKRTGLTGKAVFDTRGLWH